ISYVDHNQVSSSDDLQPQILPNQSIEIPMTITYKRIVEIANKTQCILRPVGVYNKSLEWPLGNVGSLRLVAERFVAKGHGCKQKPQSLVAFHWWEREGFGIRGSKL
ncbi:MAG: hypothetical protein ACKPB9_29780, partial [Dolichospermum sp.]